MARHCKSKPEVDPDSIEYQGLDGGKKGIGVIVQVGVGRYQKCYANRVLHISAKTMRFAASFPGIPHCQHPETPECLLIDLNAAGRSYVLNIC